MARVLSFACPALPPDAPVIEAPLLETSAAAAFVMALEVEEEEEVGAETLLGRVFVACLGAVLAAPPAARAWDSHTPDAPVRDDTGEGRAAGDGQENFL